MVLVSLCHEDNHNLCCCLFIEFSLAIFVPLSRNPYLAAPPTFRPPVTTKNNDFRLYLQP
jgi:hypothetical protein